MPSTSLQNRPLAWIFQCAVAALGYCPIVPIQIALAGNAADKIKMHDAKPASTEGRAVIFQFAASLIAASKWLKLPTTV